MGAHTVVLDLLQIPYEKVGNSQTGQLFVGLFLLFFSNNLSFYCLALPSQSDEKMNEIMTLAHMFLQNFCRGNPQNQVLLHKQLNLFLTPGVS